MLASEARMKLLMQIAAKRAHYHQLATEIIARNGKGAIKTYLGMINYVLPICLQKIFKFKAKNRPINEAELARIIKDRGGIYYGIASTGTPGNESEPTTGMMAYLRKHHPGLPCSRPTLLKYRRKLEAWGIWEVAERQFGDGRRFPTEYEISLIDALLFVEAMESVLLEFEYRFGCVRGSLDALPSHKYFSLVKLFNAAFEWLGLAYRRVWENEPLFAAWV